MRRYRYLGDIPLLQGHTALGQFIDGIFKVQVDTVHHIWSHWWHATTFEHWEPIEPNVQNVKEDSHVFRRAF